jgi:glycosyltransferase involved in cell wall biosynthesis
MLPLLIRMPSSMSCGKPILSICLPVYNAAPYLPQLLTVLKSQVHRFEGTVEVIISDDGSLDGTADLLQSLQGEPGFRCVLNTENIGMGPNILKCLTSLATGEFVWIWSQHCLLSPDGLSTVLDTIGRHAGVDGFYVNFRCATFPDDWPAEVSDSFDGPFRYLNDKRTEELLLDNWLELLRPETCLCTQTYSHIIRRQRVIEFWGDRKVSRDFGPAESTFTQTYTVTHLMSGHKAVYIGKPIFTIFNGAQTWKSLRMRKAVYYRALPELVTAFKKHGYSGDALKQAEAYTSAMAGHVTGELLRAWSEPFLVLLIRYIVLYGHRKDALMSLWKAAVHFDAGAVGKCMWSLQCRAEQVADYLFVRCRPARWWRTRNRPGVEKEPY